MLRHLSFLSPWWHESAKEAIDGGKKGGVEAGRPGRRKEGVRTYVLKETVDKQAGGKVRVYSVHTHAC